MIPERHQKKAAAVVALVIAGYGTYAGLTSYEGIVLKGGEAVAYRDASPHEIWTYCYGETKGVTKDSRATKEQCKALLAQRVASDFLPGVEACITQDMPIKVEAAFVDMAYNVGLKTFCRSSVARKWNAGDWYGACAAVKLYIHAGSKTLPGLVHRRAGENWLCEDGLAEAGYNRRVEVH